LQGIEKKYLLAALALLAFLIVVGFPSMEKNVVLTVDGKASHVKTTAQNIAGLLRQQQVKYQDQDLVFPPPSTKIVEGMNITVKHATPVMVKLDGKERKMFTLASTVRGTIKEIGIEPGPYDQITPGLKTKIIDGLQITITRPIISLDTSRVPISYKTVTKEDKNLPKGRVTVLQEGKNGTALQFFDVASIDGQEVGRELYSERMICAPVDKIVKVGTKEIERAKPAQVTTAPVSASRGGGRTLVMKATAYSPGHGCGYSTASGMRARRGIVAVDPRVIPLGTRLYIEGYGEAIAGDTGGAIKGNRIDLCFNTEAECVAFGRRNVVVHIY